MTPLRWTRTPPTEAGWWWYRERRDDLALVRVSRPFGWPERSDLEVWWIGSESEDSLRHVHGEWAGPIAPPEEDPA